MKRYYKELEQAGVSTEGAKTIMGTFFYYYLSAAQYSVDECLGYTKAWLNVCRRDLLEEYQKAKPRLCEMLM